MALVLAKGGSDHFKSRRRKRFTALPKRPNTRWGPVPKRNRWAAPDIKKTLSDDIKHLAEIAGTLDEKESQVYFLKLKLAQNAQKLYNPVAALMQNPDELSPSPPPQYDKTGKRLNTKEYRYRMKLETERNDLLTKILTIDKTFKIPSHWKKPVYRKKIPVPVDKFPEVNFFGLIVGPRGMTQKRMSKETGCEIVIRGKGSFVPGKPGRTPQDDDSEPMYISITGPSQAQVDKATKQCNLLMDQSKSGEAYKNKQLAELKSVLGWGGNPSKRCRICGGVGHPIWKCPDRPGADWDPADVQCDLCGEITHVTKDCKLYNKDSPIPMQKKAMTLDEEYTKFLSDLAGDGGMSAKAVGAIQGRTASKADLKKAYPTGTASRRPPPRPVHSGRGSPGPPRGGFRGPGGGGRGHHYARTGQGNYGGTSMAGVGGAFARASPYGAMPQMGVPTMGYQAPYMMPAPYQPMAPMQYAPMQYQPYAPVPMAYAPAMHPGTPHPGYQPPR